MKHFIVLAFILLASTTYSQTEILDNGYEEGTYVEGYKVGEWSYYDNLFELALKINYTSEKLTYLKPDTSDYVVKLNGEWLKKKLDIPPRYIGSMHEFYKLMERTPYPTKARMAYTCGTMYIAFEIDSNGSAGNYEIFHDIGDGCAEAVIATLQEIPNVWLTAQKGSSIYNARYILPVTFEIIIDDRKIAAKKLKDKSPLPLARELEEVTIAVMAIKRRGY